MLIRNYLSAPQESSVIHGGEGVCLHCAVFREADFETPVRFINYTVIPPQGSFGLHPHGEDNELYIILEGVGEYTENGRTASVKPGDIIVNARFATHGLVCTGSAPLRVLVIEAYNPSVG